MRGLIVFLCTVIFPITLFSQSYFLAGINYSTASNKRIFPFGGQEIENFKLSPAFGYGYNFKINDKFSYQPEIFFADYGSILDNNDPIRKFKNYAISFNQFIDYRPVKWFSAALSPSFYYVAYSKVSTEVVINNQTTIYGRKIGFNVNWMVLSLNPRLSFYLNDRISLNLNYRYDLKAIGYPAPIPNSYIAKEYLGSGVGINLNYQLRKGKLSQASNEAGGPFFLMGTNFTTNSRGFHPPFGKNEFENFKLSPSIGFGYRFYINEKWTYEPGISLGDWGSVNIPVNPKVFYYIYTASINQFLDFKPFKRVSFGVSPSVSYVAYAGITSKVNGINDESNLTRYIGSDNNRFVLSVSPRISYHFDNKRCLNIYYKSDLTSMGTLFPPTPGLELKEMYSYGVGISYNHNLRPKK